MIEVKETHQYGLLTLDNPENLTPGMCDIGVQIAEDGRIWICKNGITFLRFKPYPSKSRKDLRKEILNGSEPWD